MRWRRHGGHCRRRAGTGEAHEPLSLAVRDLQDVGQALHDLARGPQAAVLQMLNGHERTADAPGELLLGEIERFAALFQPRPEGGGRVHSHLLQPYGDWRRTV